MTVTGPLIRNRVAITQSFEYRFVRTPVQSLPPTKRDMKLETLDSFTQADVSLSDRHSATPRSRSFPKNWHTWGLNTFTPQESTPDLHQRGYQAALQDRYVFGANSLLTSQFNYQKTDADVLPNSTAPYRLLLETTEGGFFDRQNRRSNRVQWQELYQSGEHHFLGTHTLKVGFDFSHSDYDGRQEFSPVDIVGTAGYALERIAVRRARLAFRSIRMNSPGSPAISGVPPSGSRSTSGCGSTAIRSPIPLTRLRAAGSRLH